MNITELMMQCYQTLNDKHFYSSNIRERNSKMVIHKCDNCGIELTIWYTVHTGIKAENAFVNVNDMLPFRTDYDLCKTCYNKIFGDLKNGYIGI